MSASSAEHYGHAEVSSPMRMKGLHDAALAAAETGALDDALRMLRVVVAREPDAVESRHGLEALLVRSGRALQQSGRVDEALEAYREALDIRPGLAGASSEVTAAIRALLSDRVCAELDAGSLEAAGAWLDRWLELLAQDIPPVEILDRFAMTAAERGAHPSAVTVLRAVLERQEPPLAARETLAVVLESQAESVEGRDAGSALRLREEALAICPNDARLAEAFVEAALQRVSAASPADDLDALRCDLDRARAAGAPAWRLTLSFTDLAVAAVAFGRLKWAVDAARDEAPRLSRGPGLRRLAASLGGVARRHADDGRWEAAGQALGAALALRPLDEGLRRAVDDVAEVAETAGDRGVAIALLREVAAVAPDVAGATLAKLLHDQARVAGQTRRALEDLREAWALASTHGAEPPGTRLRKDLQAALRRDIRTRLAAADLHAAAATATELLDLDAANSSVATLFARVADRTATEGGPEAQATVRDALTRHPELVRRRVEELTARAAAARTAGDDPTAELTARLEAFKLLEATPGMGPDASHRKAVTRLLSIRARDAVRADDLDAAIAALRTLMSIDPDEQMGIRLAEALTRRTMKSLAVDELDVAESMATEAYGLDPSIKREPTLRRLAARAMRAEAPDVALRVLRLVPEANASDELLKMLGTALERRAAELERSDDADGAVHLRREALTRSVAADPPLRDRRRANLARALATQATRSTADGQSTHALESIREALALAPSEPACHRTVATIARVATRPGEVTPLIEALREAVRDGACDPQIHARLAGLLQHDGALLHRERSNVEALSRYREAEQVLRAAGLEPDHKLATRVQRVLGPAIDQSLLTGEVVEACDLLRASLHLPADTWHPLLDRVAFAALYAVTPDRAIALLRAALQRLPGDAAIEERLAELLEHEADVQVSLGDLESAERLLDEADELADDPARTAPTRQLLRALPRQSRGPATAGSATNELTLVVVENGVDQYLLATYLAAAQPAESVRADELIGATGTGDDDAVEANTATMLDVMRAALPRSALIVSGCDLLSVLTPDVKQVLRHAAGVPRRLAERLAGGDYSRVLFLLGDGRLARSLHPVAAAAGSSAEVSFMWCSKYERRFDRHAWSLDEHDLPSQRLLETGTSRISADVFATSPCGTARGPAERAGAVAIVNSRAELTALEPLVRELDASVSILLVTGRADLITDLESDGLADGNGRRLSAVGPRPGTDKEREKIVNAASRVLDDPRLGAIEAAGASLWPLLEEDIARLMIEWLPGLSGFARTLRTVLRHRPRALLVAELCTPQARIAGILADRFGVPVIAADDDRRHVDGG